MTIKREIDGKVHQFELTNDELVKSFTESLAIMYRNAVECHYETNDELQAWRKTHEDEYVECVNASVEQLIQHWDWYDELLDNESIEWRANEVLNWHGVEDEIYGNEEGYR